MEKIKLRAVFIIALYAFSCFFIFAEEDDKPLPGGKETEETSSGDGQTNGDENGSGASGGSANTPQKIDSDSASATSVPATPAPSPASATPAAAPPAPSPASATPATANPAPPPASGTPATATPAPSPASSTSATANPAPPPASGTPATATPAPPPASSTSATANPPSQDKNGGGTTFEKLTSVEKEELTSFAKIIMLLLAASIALNMLNIILLFTKENKKKIRSLGKKIDYLENENNTVKSQIDECERKMKELPYNVANNRERLEMPENPSASSRIIEDIVADIENRLQEVEKNQRSLTEQKAIARSITSGSLDITDGFNLWAKNPSVPLSREIFYYIEGEMNIRAKREIKESAVETKWITNRSGNKKYLFPNPNSFHPMTNISEFYKMDLSKLKGRGQNKIQIITPCEMTNDGFVEFRGEVELL
jgi:cell division protein FtsL